MLSVILEIVEEEMNLFPMSLMGTTIQDGGLREKTGTKTMFISFSLLISKFFLFNFGT